MQDPLSGNYRALGAAILFRAAKDAESQDGLIAWPARLWLGLDPFAERLLAGFEVEQRLVLGWVRKLPLARPVWAGPVPLNHYQVRKIKEQLAKL